MASEETTTKLNVDISELKKSMQDAKRAVSVANSEFKASVSTLENWSNTTEGVSAKIKQLNSNVKSHEKILDSLEQQYKAVVEEQGENSKAAQNLEIRINNQKATVNKTAMELKKYENQLQTLESEQKKVEQETEKQISTYDKLRSTINEQENELANLKKEYANTALEQGKNSDSARELAGKIENLSTELNANKTIMKNADKAADDLDNSLDDTADAAKEASEGFTVMKGAIADLIADGLEALAQSAKECMQELVFETEQAYDTFQAKTGTATEAMGEFEDVINDLYRNNYGESFADIADAMAEVKQQTNEVDPSKLKELTKNALVLRDTFDFDVQESMRAVNMLITQFGISGEEAYNLIVQGAQKGLNKNGDLLDTINEYGVHYKQLGYDSEDFFNSLVNGAKTGTFSVDKLGDAVKEFGIRTKDTAQSTTEGFELIGLNADEMRKAFAKGGDSAQKATQKTLKALFEMKDEVKQNQAGVALFGTMWEDLGIEGVKALMNTEGELQKTKASMKELDQIKYDNVGAKFAQIGRSIQMDVILPLAQKALPTIEKFANKFITDGDKIISHLKTIGAVIATVFVVNKIATFTQSIITMVTAWKKMKDAITAAEGAQKLFNITQGATPWGAIALTIGAVVGGIVAYTAATGDAKSETEKFCEQIKASSEEIHEQVQAYKESEAARQSTLQGISSEYSYYEQLVDELSNITDENGKVVKGYETRAQVITGLLSDALGTEISTDKLVAEGKQKVIDKIKELIEVQKAEAMLEAYKSDHLEALKLKEEAYKSYIKQKKEATKASENLAAAEKELADYQEAFAEMTYTTEEDLAAYNVQVGNLTEKVDKCKEAQKNATQAVDDAHYKYLGYMNTIEAYNGVSAAIIEGDSAKINEALVLMSNNFKTAENSTREMLEGQVTAAKENLALLQQALKDGEPGITQQMVTNAQLMVDKSVAELDKLAPKSKPPAEKHTQYFSSGITDNLGIVRQAGTAAANEAVKGEGSKTAESEKAGANTVDYFSSGVLSQKPQANQAGTSVANETVEGERSKTSESEKAGAEQGQSHADGMNSKTGATNAAGKNIAQSGKSGSGSVSAYSTGADFTQGFINGMGSLLWNVAIKAAGIALAALTALKNKIDSNSPAKETIKLGEFFGEGFVVGIDNLITDCIKISEKLGEEALKSLESSLEKTTKLIDETGEEMLESEKLYLSEKERLEKEAEEAEYQEKLQNAKTAEEQEKIKQEKIKKEQEKANQKYLDDLKATADKEREIYNKRLAAVKAKAEEIKSYINSYVEAAKNKFSEFIESSKSKVDEFKSLRQGIESAFNSSGNNTFSTVKFISGAGEEVFTKLADVGEDNKALEEYSSMLDKLVERSGGELPEKLSSYLSNMGLEDGTSFLNALLKSSDKEFNAYLSNLEEKERLAGEISTKLTSKQAEDLANEIKNGAESLFVELVHNAEKIPDVLAHIGGDCADSFGAEFIPKMTSAIDEVTKIITNNLSGIITSLDVTLSNANLNLSGINANLSGGGVGGGAVYNYTQVINSPSTVNRLELYRHSKNLLRLQGGVL